MRVWAGFKWFSMSCGGGGGSYERGTESSESHKRRGTFFLPGERNGVHGAVQMRCCSIKILVYGDLFCL
jgi:hypothetical protein